MFIGSPSLTAWHLCWLGLGFIINQLIVYEIYVCLISKTSLICAMKRPFFSRQRCFSPEPGDTNLKRVTYLVLDEAPHFVRRECKGLVTSGVILIHRFKLVAFRVSLQESLVLRILPFPNCLDQWYLFPRYSSGFAEICRSLLDLFQGFIWWINTTCLWG